MNTRRCLVSALILPVLVVAALLSATAQTIELAAGSSSCTVALDGALRASFFVPAICFVLMFVYAVVFRSRKKA